MTRTLHDLLADIEGATRFRRDLDREIGLTIAGWSVTGKMLADHKGNTYVDHPGGEYPSFTYDVSLALDLADRLFPGRGRIQTLTPTQDGLHCVTTIIDMPEDPEASADDPRGWATHYSGKGASEALAACAAVVARAIGVPRR